MTYRVENIHCQDIELPAITGRLASLIPKMVYTSRMRRYLIHCLLAIGWCCFSKCSITGDSQEKQAISDTASFAGFISKIPGDTLPHYSSSSYGPQYRLNSSDTIYFKFFQSAKLVPIIDKQELDEYKLKEDSIIQITLGSQGRSGGYYMKNLISNDHLTILEMSSDYKKYLLLYNNNGKLLNAIAFGQVLESTDIHQGINSKRYLALKKDLQLEITDELRGEKIESTEINSIYQITENGDLVRGSYKKQVSPSIQLLDSLVNPKVKLYEENQGYYLSVFQNNRWQPWFLFSEANQFSSAKMEAININSSGNNEIIVNWTFSTFHNYGNGGGGWSSSFKSLDILDIDARSSLFSATYFEISQSWEPQADSTGNIDQKETTSASYEYDVKINDDNSITVSNLHNPSEDLPFTPPRNFKEGTYVLRKGQYVLR